MRTRNQNQRAIDVCLAKDRSVSTTRKEEKVPTSKKQKINPNLIIENDNSMPIKQIKLDDIENTQKTSNPVLIELGTLVEGTVTKRPSIYIKTPYVSDVSIPGVGEVLAHTPALECAGMVAPNKTVYMTKNVAKKGATNSLKTTHSLRIAVDIREKGMPTVLVGAHPQLAEQIALQALEGRLIPGLDSYKTIQREKKFENTRVDFVLKETEDENEKMDSTILLEVKNVVCADFPEGEVPEERGKVGIYTSGAKPYRRTAIFPHGGKKPKIKVVSDRAIKQLNDLIRLSKLGYKCVVLFIVNRGDCEAFRPCHEADMLLAQMLLKAKQNEVMVLAHSVEWGLDGVGRWGRPLEVVFDESVRAEDIDYEHLERVLEFNSDPKNARRPPKKSKQKENDIMEQ